MTFSGKLRALINRAIDSVEHVEVLLLLKRNADRAWTAQQVADELRRATPSVERRLRDLARARLLAVDEAGYRYGAGSQSKAVDELEREYEQRRVRLIEAIFTRSIDSARTFADAFRLWGEEDDR